MYRLSSHSRRVTAATLLVVFLNVFFGQVVCALAMPAAPAKHEHHAGAESEHHHDSEDAKPHHHETGAANHHPHDTPGSHSHKSGAKGSCCQDDAAAVWASLTHPPKVGVDKMVSLVFTMPAPFALVARIHHWDRTRPVQLVARRQLKPKIPDIRIFIQSLTV